VGLNDLVELSKRIYVEQAQQQLRREGRRVTDAALSTLTGVHRKDVKRIVEAGPLAPSGRQAQPARRRDGAVERRPALHR
jgi:hypothetical protein